MDVPVLFEAILGLHLQVDVLDPLSAAHDPYVLLAVGDEDCGVVLKWFFVLVNSRYVRCVYLELEDAVISSKIQHVLLFSVEEELLADILEEWNFLKNYFMDLLVHRGPWV